MDSALCAEVGGDLFFADKGKWVDTFKAKTVCARCHVSAECLAYALQNDEMHGVWGGTTPEQRKRFRGAQRRGLAS
jgi:WhiB family redox-sensing transcriptional regulator